MGSSRTESSRVGGEEPATIPLLTEFLFCGAAVVASLLLWRFLQNATFLLFYPVVTVSALRWSGRFKVSVAMPPESLRRSCGVMRQAFSLARPRE